MKRIWFLGALVVWLAGCATPSTFVIGQTKTWGVIVDDANVYWTDCGPIPPAHDGRVMKKPKSGGAPVELVSVTACSDALVLDDANVYFFAARSTIARVAKAGGVPTILVIGTDIRAFAVDDTNVYWTECLLSAKVAMIMKLPKRNGGVPTRVAWVSNCANVLAVDATHLYWMDGLGLRRVDKIGGEPVTIATGGDVRNLILDDAHLYWLDDVYIMRLAKTDGARVILAQSEKETLALTIDAANLYWTTTSGKVIRTSKNGGVKYLLTESNRYAIGIAVDDANVYWTNLGDAVWHASKTGGAPIIDVEMPGEMRTLVVAQAGITDVALDETHVYWATCFYSGSNVGLGNIGKVSKNGGAPTWLAVDQPCPRHIALDAANVYWVNEGIPTAGEYRDGSIVRVAKIGGTPTTLVAKVDGRAAIAVDETHAYWTDCGIDAIRRVPKQGGAPETFASSRCPSNIIVDVTSVYWSETESVKKLDKRGGAAQTIALRGASVLAIDQTSIYWARTEQTSRSGLRSCADERSVLIKSPKDGGVSTQLAQLSGIAPTKLALDDANVYWANDCTDGILRVAKTGGAPQSALMNQTVRYVMVDATGIYWVVYSEGAIKKKSQ